MPWDTYMYVGGGGRGGWVGGQREPEVEPEVGPATLCDWFSGSRVEMGILWFDFLFGCLRAGCLVRSVRHH